MGTIFINLLLLGMCAAAARVTYLVRGLYRVSYVFVFLCGFLAALLINAVFKFLN
jgi:hypothetical protein